MIDGVKITPLRQIKDNRGKIMHMMRSDHSIFKGFGEIYFSTVNPKIIKAWHLHKEVTLNYACVRGRVELALLMTEIKVKLMANIKNSFTNEYFLVTIPPLYGMVSKDFTKESQ